MTMTLIFNAALAAVILVTILGMKLWAVRTQHHGVVESELTVEHEMPRVRYADGADAEDVYERGEAAA